MPTPFTTVDPLPLKRVSTLLGLYALIGGIASLSGWVFDVPRLTDWLGDNISTQPNTAVLIACAGAAILLFQYGYKKLPLLLGGFVALGGALNLLQYITGADFGFNHQLLFGREWGHKASFKPGRFGLPASISFMFIGFSLVLLGMRNDAVRRYVPPLSLMVVLLMVFSLLGYLFGARNFYAIPWLSAIALPTATMLLALTVSVIVNVPQYHPMLLLCERSSAGTMARTVLPILIIIIPLFIWLRTKGHELGFFDQGTSRALGAAMLIIAVVALMWIALMALRRREQREREADQRKDEFLATLAHELRNPLAPISNAAAVLKIANGNRDMLERATGTIDRQLVHLVRLVDDLLDMSRISRGKLELRREPIELAAVIQQAVETSRSLFESAKHTFNLTLPSEPIYLNGDAVRLTQVVSNLLSNACKFAGQHGQIDLTVERRDKWVTISVKDNGIGIPPDMLESIFEMFLQVDQSLERSQSGLGIGLTLAKRLVELHEGRIDARSEGLGKGSEFIVRLPITIDQTLPLTKTENIKEANAETRILIVDDNRDSAQTLAQVLELSGNQTFMAHDGEEAVAAAEQQRPDVILLDIGLPKLNGFDACRRIRENAWADTVLIVALTGWGQEEYRRKSAEAGFDRHLVKPVDLGKLMALLANSPLRQ
ncbi:hybrid sensor histidine kinase/response regulator [Cellvibrio sp. ARAG 10.3]|uniref:hybrid sensor histidine kinase/response regulator n=1 Tax=Cellvibrio sp. ARAG 10.3 TaxID=3451358 RepID=UPI003F47025A